MTVTTNQRGPSGYLTFKATASDGLRLTANSSFAGANVNSSEVVQEMFIVGAMWSVSGTNTWDIKRGSNTVLVLAGSGTHDYSGEGIRIEADTAQATSNVDATLSGGTGTLILKIHKRSGE